MRMRSIMVALATTAMMMGPALVHGVLGATAGAKAECTITGTAANDELYGGQGDDQVGEINGASEKAGTTSSSRGTTSRGTTR